MSVKDAAADAAEFVRDQAVSIRIDPPNSSGWKLILILLALLPVAFWAGGCNVKKERDAWWRANIAESSAAVKAVISKEGAGIAVTDEEVLKALGEADAKQTEAEQHLRDARRVDSPDGCPRVPRICMR